MSNSTDYDGHDLIRDLFNDIRLQMLEDRQAEIELRKKQIRAERRRKQQTKDKKRDKKY